MNSLRTYQLALELYGSIEAELGNIKGPKKNQLERAALSISLNLSEGSSRPTEKDRRRFYFIALGSLRETQTLILLCKLKHLEEAADKVGAYLYKLCHS